MIIPLALFAMIFGIVFVVVRTYHKERMALIKAGMNPAKSSKSEHNRLRGAMLFFFVPLGVLFGQIFYQSINMNSETASVLMAFMMGGVALLITYIVESKRSSNKNQ